jgi:hypothetical protein
MRQTMMHSNTRVNAAIRRCIIFLFGLTTLLLIPSQGEAQTVLNRARLGNNIEDITFVKTGPLANQIIMMDGYEVFALPVDKAKHSGGGGHNNDDNDDNDNTESHRFEKPPFQTRPVRHDW